MRKVVVRMPANHNKGLRLLEEVLEDASRDPRCPLLRRQSIVRSQIPVPDTQDAVHRARIATASWVHCRGILSIVTLWRT
jgi:hypothetical protein